MLGTWLVKESWIQKAAKRRREKHTKGRMSASLTKKQKHRVNQVNSIFSIHSKHKDDVCKIHH